LKILQIDFGDGISVFWNEQEILKLAFSIDSFNEKVSVHVMARSSDIEVKKGIITANNQKGDEKT